MEEAKEHLEKARLIDPTNAYIYAFQERIAFLKQEASKKNIAVSNRKAMEDAARVKLEADRKRAEEERSLKVNEEIDGWLQKKAEAEKRHQEELARAVSGRPMPEPVQTPRIPSPVAALPEPAPISKIPAPASPVIEPAPATKISNPVSPVIEQAPATKIQGTASPVLEPPPAYKIPAPASSVPKPAPAPRTPNPAAPAPPAPRTPSPAAPVPPAPRIPVQLLLYRNRVQI